MVSELADFLALKGKSQGLIDAKSNFSGSFATSRQNLLIDSKGAIVEGGLDRFTLSNKSQFDFRTNVIFDKSIKVMHAKLEDNHGLRLQFNGESDWDNSVFQFSFDLKCPELTRYYFIHEKSDSVAGLKTHGIMAKSGGIFRLQADAQANTINIARLKASNITAGVELVDDRVTLTNVSAEFYAGRLLASIAIADLFKEGRIAADITLEGIELASLSRRFIPMSATGKLSASINVAGTVKDPAIKFTSEIEDLTIDRAQIKSSQIEGEYLRQQLKIAKLFAFASAGTFESDNLTVDFATKKIGGDLKATNVSIASVLFGYAKKVDGDLEGTIHFGGTLDAPQITAPLTVTGLVAHSIKLGRGAVTLSLAKEPLIGFPKEKDIVFSLSANLEAQGSTTLARFAYALNKKTVNVDLNVDDIELNTVSLGFLISPRA